MRSQLPAPVHHPKLKKNKNYFRVYEVRSFIEGISPEEIIWTWAREYVFPHAGEIPTLEKVEFVVNGAHKLLGVQKPLIPLDIAALEAVKLG